MARYCFYCGRELEDSEKCDCRVRPVVTGAGRDTPAREAGTRHERSRTAPEHDTSSPRYHTGTWQHREEFVPPKKTHKARRSGASTHAGKSPASRALRIQSFLRFFAAPADTMARELSPQWTASHSIWLTITIALSGLHYMLLNRGLETLLSGETTKLTVGETLLSWLSGSAFIALILVLFTLTLWLLARFLYRQGGLPFCHALAAGRVAWKYLTLFFLLALPSFFTAGAVYGLVLALMGLVFSIIVHARQVAALTHLDENRTWQLTYLSIIIFAGIFSSVTSLVQMLNAVR